MNCPVCFQPAEERPTGFDGQELICRGCGHFKLSRSLLAIMGRRMFDVDEARSRIEIKRLTTSVPMLDTTDEDLLTLHR